MPLETAGIHVASRNLPVFMAAVLSCFARLNGAEYVGSIAGPTSPAIKSAGMEVLGSGGGAGAFTYKGGGNAIDAAVAAALTACVVSPVACSLGGYGGHMLIYKSGWDGEPPLVTCIDFNSTAGSLASSNMFVGSVDLTNGHWIGAQPPAARIGWKAVGVPGTFAGLYMAQTNYGRKLGGTNYFSFAEIMKPTMTRVASGQVSGNSYYTLSSVSNLLMDLYTNSPGYTESNGQPNPHSVNNPYTVFYAGDIAVDIAAAMQAYGGLVTYEDMANYRPIETQPYLRHFNPPNGTPATVYVAPPGSAGLSVLQQLTIMEALGWTNGPAGTWDSLKYWHSRAETARLMWKEHFQWLGDPWSGVKPPDILGNGSTNFCEQLLAHATNGYSLACPWDPNEVRLTNSLAAAVAQSVNNQTNITISVDWDDVRYGTFHLSTCDKWGNCVSVTWSMGGGYGAQVALTNRGLVFGQGMALFDARPGWPDSIAPGKRPVNNMCPAIVVPDFPGSSANGVAGGRPPFAVGGGGGSTIENHRAMQLIKYLTDPPSSPVVDPPVWLYNYEGNKSIYMRPSYPAGVQSYLTNVGLSAPGLPPTSGDYSYVQAWVPPVLLAQPGHTNVLPGSTVTFNVSATGLPLFYQWLRDGIPLTDGAAVSGSQSPSLTLSSITTGASYSVLVTNGAAVVMSAPVAVTVNGAPVITAQPSSSTNFTGTTAAFSVSASGSGPLSFQWLRNDSNIYDSATVSGSATSQLEMSPVALSDAADYSVTVSNAVGGVISDVATLTVWPASPSLSLLWGIGPAGSQPWMNTSPVTGVPNQRTIAYNALSNQLYVVSRSSNTTSNYVIYVLNATNGALLYTLKTNGIQSNVGKGGIGLVGVAVADDGAIYACNTATDAAGSAGTDPTSFFRVYRWADAHSNTSPALIFTRDPTGTTSPMRWGDNLAVRGAGTNTQILVDMTWFGATAGTNGFASILSPSNAFLTNFTSRWFTTTNLCDTVGRSLEFDLLNNALWQKGAGKTLYKTTFSPTASLGGARIASSNVLEIAGFPSALMGVGLDLTRNLAAGVFSNSTATADSLKLYDITDVNAPTLLAQYEFPNDPRIANGNRISQTLFKNDLAFTLDANNGIMAFKITLPPATVRLAGFSKLPNGAFQFHYANNDGRTYRVFASTNLVDWTFLGNAAQISPGLFQFADLNAGGIPHRFYQLRSP